MCYFKLAVADNAVNWPCLNEPVLHYIVMDNLLSAEAAASSLVPCALFSIIRQEKEFARGDLGVK